MQLTAQSKFSAHDHPPIRYAVTLLAKYTPEEQQVLSAKNLWLTNAVVFPASLGFWRGTKQYNVKYYELCIPGYVVDGFTKSAANQFIAQSHEIVSVMTRTLAELIRTYQLEHRDAFFHGGTTIDVTPTVPMLPTMPPAPRGLPQIGKLDLDGVPTKNHSRINLADFVRDKISPTPPANVPEVEVLTWHFDEPEDDDDHTVRLYAVLSAEERAIIKRFGLHHHSFGEVQLFDEDALERLQHAQEQELAATIDAAARASLRIEHKEQLKYAREAKTDITIEDFMAYPLIKTFPNRWQATAGQKKMQGTMMEIKKMLENHRDK